MNFYRKYAKTFLTVHSEERCGFFNGGSTRVCVSPNTDIHFQDDSSDVCDAYFLRAGKYLHNFNYTFVCVSSHWPRKLILSGGFIL